MTLGDLLVAVIIWGIIYWLVMQLPLPGPAKKIAQVILVLLALSWLLGLMPVLPHRHLMLR